MTAAPQPTEQKNEQKAEPTPRLSEAALAALGEAISAYRIFCAEPKGEGEGEAVGLGGSVALVMHSWDSARVDAMILVDGRVRMLRAQLGVDADNPPEPREILAVLSLEGYPAPCTTLAGLSGLTGNRAWSERVADHALSLLEDGGLSPEEREEIRMSMMVVAQDWAQRAAAAFVAKLPEAVKAGFVAVGTVADFSEHALAWYSRDEKMGEYRRQAAKAYPLLAGYFAEPTSISSRAAIDNGVALTPVLAEIFGLNKAKAKSLSQNVQQEGVEVNDLFALLHACPPEWGPKTKEEGEAFRDSADIVARLSAASGLGYASLIRQVGGKWNEFLIRAGKGLRYASALRGESERERRERQARMIAAHRAGVSRRGALGEVIAEGLSTMRERLANEVILPLAANRATADGRRVVLTPKMRETAYEAATEILFGKASLPDLVSIAERYSVQADILHRERLEQEAAAGPRRETLLGQISVLQGGEEGAGWPAPLEPVDLPRGHRLRFMTDRTQMSEVGSALAICVGWFDRYKNAAISGKGICAVIEQGGADGEWVPQACIEFTIDQKAAGGLRSIQERGHDNGHLPPGAQAGLDWFMDSLARGTLEPDIQTFVDHGEARMAEIKRLREAAGPEEHRHEARRRFDEIENLCGYDWSDAESVSAKLAQWADGRTTMGGTPVSPVFPKPLWRATPDQFCQLPAMKELIHEMNPWAQQRFREEAAPNIPVAAPENAAPAAELA